MSFQYAPLPSQRSLRLIHILPYDADPVLSCMLNAYPIDNAPPFDALSYAWHAGSKSGIASHTIKCNFKSMTIGASLYAAILQLRSDGDVPLLWADAISINQSDLEEKTSQVRMMEDVYKNARRVLVWLGEERLESEAEDGGDRMGVAIMERICEVWPEGTSLGRMSQDNCDKSSSDGSTTAVRGERSAIANTDIALDERDSNAAEPKLGERGETTSPLPTLPEYGSPQWMSFVNLLTRPWFRRLWVVQEFVLAQEALFLSGSLRVPPSVLLRAAFLCGQIGDVLSDIQESLARYAEGGREFSGACLQCHLLMLFKQKYLEGKDVELSELWTIASFTNATDERDKIFGLASFSSPLGKDIINYKTPATQIFIKIATMAIEQWLPFMIFARGGRQGLPSWVTDWSFRPSNKASIPLTSTWIRWKRSSIIPYPYMKPTKIEGNRLQLYGTRIDTLQAFASEPPAAKTTDTSAMYLSSDDSTVVGASPSTMKYYGEIAAWTKECLSHFTPDPVNPPPGVEEAFARTIVFDELKVNNVPIVNARPSQYVDAYRAWLRAAELVVNMPDWNGPDEEKRVWAEELLEVKDASEPLAHNFAVMTIGRKFCVSDTKHMGWVPSTAEEGDVVVLVVGMVLPLILRPIGDGEWTLIGEAYVHGVMEWNGTWRADTWFETFVLQ